MAYYIQLFSPETYLSFSDSDRTVAGFRARQQSMVASVQPGDKLICYMTKLSRWIGVMDVTSNVFIDQTPIFSKPNDPFCVRVRVSTRVWLEPKWGVPIQNDVCWKHLSFTKELHKSSSNWTNAVRRSLRRLSDEDGAYLESLLTGQVQAPCEYSLSLAEQRKLRPTVINSESGQIVVSVPDEDAETENHRAGESEHVRIQTKLAEIGDLMGFKIWLPRADRQRVLENWHPSSGNVLLEHLPLNYNNVTLRIVENIDVLWIRHNAIIHAFEVEHTTSIYSGLLRMADLMALQPNLSIKAHIVAPQARRAKVLREISRPVFALMESGSMAEICTYFSYDGVYELRNEKNLQHLSDSVLEEYVEYAQEADF